MDNFNSKCTKYVIIMSDKKEEMTIEERIKILEDGFENARKQTERLVEQLMGMITILCLPMSPTKKLEFGFKTIEKLPNQILKIIIRRYVEESKKIDIKFDDMIDPMFLTFGFERLWKILNRETIREFYGEWALSKWETMGKSHKCEE